VALLDPAEFPAVHREETCKFTSNFFRYALAMVPHTWHITLVSNGGLSSCLRLVGSYVLCECRQLDRFSCMQLAGQSNLVMCTVGL
jgi:hypothetical protein